jgi:hypothetical protein
MAKIAIGFGVVLAALGVWGFVSTGSAHPTALIPLWFGLVLVVCGVLARTEDAKRRMLWMHIAVTVGLLGFLVPAVRGGGALVRAHSQGVPLQHAAAVHAQLLMALVCFVFVAMCVRSFVAARRGRLG